MKVLAAVLALVGWGAILANGVGFAVRVTKRVWEIRMDQKAKREAMLDHQRAMLEHYEE